MATKSTPINNKAKREFVIAYTCRVMADRMKAVDKSVLPCDKLYPKATKAVEALGAGLPKDERFRTLYLQHYTYLDLSLFRDMHGQLQYDACKGLDKALLTSREYERACNHGKTLMANTLRNSLYVMMPNLKSHHTALSRRTYGLEQAATSISVYLPHNLSGRSSCRTDRSLSWPVKWVHERDADNNPTGDKHLEVFDRVTLFATERKQQALLDLTEAHFASLQGLHTAFEEATDFCATLYKALEPARTVKKIEEQWPDLWPDFKELTGLSTIDDGKQMALPNADVKRLEIAINTYKASK